MTINVLFLLDLAAFLKETERAVDQCLLTVARVLACCWHLGDKGTQRWGYRIINSQCHHAAFATRYRKVVESSGEGCPAGGPLQKGKY